MDRSARDDLVAAVRHQRCLLAEKLEQKPEPPVQWVAVTVPELEALGVVLKDAGAALAGELDAPGESQPDPTAWLAAVQHELDEDWSLEGGGSAASVWLERKIPGTADGFLTYGPLVNQPERQGWAVYDNGRSIETGDAPDLDEPSDTAAWLQGLLKAQTLKAHERRERLELPDILESVRKALENNIGQEWEIGGGGGAPWWLGRDLPGARCLTWGPNLGDDGTGWVLTRDGEILDLGPAPKLEPEGLALWLAGLLEQQTRNAHEQEAGSEGPPYDAATRTGMYDHD